MNTIIDLPNDFRKKNPKAKRSEYPVLTGLNVFYLGKSIIPVCMIKMNKLIYSFVIFSWSNSICRLD